MGRTILTDAAVRRLRAPATGRLEVWDAALPGFGVRITDRGHRSFVLVTRLGSKPIRVTLGAYPKTELRDARKRARAALDTVARGDDPRAAKRPVVPASTDPLAVEHIAAAFIEKHAKVRNRTWREQERILTRNVVPPWKGRRLDALRRTDVVALVDALAATAPIMANRTLEVVKKLFNWALNRGLIEAHPAVGLTPPAPEHSRDHVLTDPEMKSLWQAWSSLGYPFGPAFQILALTATRCSEVAGMQWDELDLDANVWTVPTARVKSKVPHVVPLSPAAAALLVAVPRLDGCAYVFSTRQRRPIGFSTKKVQEISKASGVTGWRTHDLRRTARTGLSKLGVSADIAERVLGHTIGGVRGVYDRHDYLDQKRDALDKWAAHLTALVPHDG